MKAGERRFLPSLGFFLVVSATAQPVFGLRVERVPVELGYFSSDYDPSYSPDGRLVFMRSQRVGPPHWDFYSGVWVFSHGSTRALSSYLGVRTPALSAGGHLVYEIDGDIEVLRANGESVKVTEVESLERNPTWSPVAPQVAFESNRDGSFDLFVAVLTGEEPIQLTSSSSNDVQPAWSPDGSKIAFSSNRAGSMNIWVVPAGGGEPIKVTYGSYSDGEPTWSPDGEFIAYSSDRSGSRDIWMVELGTGVVHRLTDDDGYEEGPTWAPDGESIVYSASRDGALYRIMDLETVGVKSSTWSELKSKYRE